jgi:hypothetical protein
LASCQRESRGESNLGELVELVALLELLGEVGEGDDDVVVVLGALEQGVALERHPRPIALGVVDQVQEQRALRCLPGRMGRFRHHSPRSYMHIYIYIHTYVHTHTHRGI